MRLYLFLSLLTIIVVSAGLRGFSSEGMRWKERDYQRRFCHEIGGMMEVRLADRSRVDCLSDEYAVEVEFGRKWAEGAGQALYYAEMTKRRPAVALILGKSRRDRRYLERLDLLAGRYGIRIFTIERKE
jgi:hypothetical protein